ncbi:MAG: hypothetical protein U0559_05105 [Anaerolineae bacterium]
MHTTAYWFCVEPDVADQLIDAGVILLRLRSDWVRSDEIPGARLGIAVASAARLNHLVAHTMYITCGPSWFGYRRGANHNDQLANVPENLITLCRACHHRVETAVGVRGALSGLGHVLGEIAPLYLICDHATSA